MPYNRIDTGGPSWSSDSGQVAYCANISGQSNLWVSRADGSGNRNLTNNINATIHFASPIWAPNDTRLAFLSVANGAGELDTTWSLYITEGETLRLLFHSDHYLRLLGWSTSGTEVLVVSAESENFTNPAVRDVEILRLSVSGPDHDPVTRFESTYPFSIRLSPNRNDVLCISRRDGTDNIWVLPTVGGAARKMTGNRDPGLYFSSPSWSPDGATIYYGRQERRNVVSMIELPQVKGDSNESKKL